MLKKLMALAASTAMLGANAAAHVIGTARAALKSAGGSAAAGDAGKERAGDGRNILPSIPPLPPMAAPERAAPKPAAPKPAARKSGGSKGTAHKISKARDQGVKPTRRTKKKSAR